MLTPLKNQELPKNGGSKIIVTFVCDCGNHHSTAWRNYTSGRIKSCGKCELFIFKNNIKDKYHMLSLITNVDEIQKLSQKALWKCDCGKTKYITLKSVLTNLTKSCGCHIPVGHSKNNLKTAKNSKPKTAAEWLSLIPNLVKNQKLPESWTSGSGHEFLFLCQCGKIFKRKFCKYKNGISTCGDCDVISIQKGESAGLGGLIYYGTKTTIKTNSYEKDLFLCKCGKTNLIAIQHVFFRNQKTCGLCNTKPREWWEEQKFGHLKIKDIDQVLSLSKKSEQLIDFICSCGKPTKAHLDDVTNGNTKSCGSCRAILSDWYLKNKTILKNLTRPCLPEAFPKGGPEPLEPLLSLNKKYQFKCFLCQNKYQPYLHDVLNGKSLSCGCSSSRVSTAITEIASYLESFGLETETEFKLKSLSYDLLVKNHNLLIEFNGLRWHSYPVNKKQDLKKYQNAIQSGYNIIVIFEDEWNKKQTIIKDIILSKLQLVKYQSVRPSQCSIHLIKPSQANQFYETHHYLGKTASRFHYGVFYKGQLVACVSFRKPVRQTMKYDWEISRMASIPSIKIHGLWSKILNMFLNLQKPTSIVTFSDNRLFSGLVYQKMGFVKDSNVNSDYFWVKNQHRYNKSSLRKTGELVTETKLREAQGYRKIWDCGKVRWVIRVTEEKENNGSRKI